MSIVWEDPPEPVRGNNGRWNPIVDQLKARPGVWAHVDTAKNKESASVLVSNLRRGKYIGVIVAEIEATHRDVKVYARYVGGES
jgi:hypothetical protein